MTLSNSYKNAMDKITLSEEKKQSIIKNTSEALNKKRKKSNILYLKRTVGLAACFAICFFSYYLVTNYIYKPDNTETKIVTVPVQKYNEENKDKTEEIKEKNNITDNKEVKNNSQTSADIENNINQSQIAVQNDEQRFLKSPLTDQTKENQSEIVPIEPDDNSLNNSEEKPPVAVLSVFNDDALSGNTPRNDDENSMHSVEEIENTLGYTIKTPAYIPLNYQLVSSCLIAGDIAQITYESENDTICYRTSKGNEDISGDYNTYTNVEIININNKDVTFKGNDNLYYNASWSDDENSFSIYSDSGIEREAIISIVESVKDEQ